MYEVPGLAALLAHGLALALVRLASSGPRPGTWAHSCTQCSYRTSVIITDSAWFSVPRPPGQLDNFRNQQMGNHFRPPFINLEATNFYRL